MTSRILPHEEWARLEGTELGPVWRALDPAVARVIVVEDTYGQIAGCWSLLPFVHAEGLWIAPAHRGKSAVLRQLWQALISSANEIGIQSVVTSAASDEVAEILVKRGARPMPASYVLDTDSRPNGADRKRGEQFHHQLFAVLPASAQHPDDGDHDAAVGRAIRVGLDEGAPERAERQYNGWALQHGYAPVKFLGLNADGQMVVDIVEAVIAFDATGGVSVIESRLEVPCPV